MRILGISAGFHDAAVTVVEDGEILFAGHSERYSKKKHDSDLCGEILEEAVVTPIDQIAYYERPLIKKSRQLYSGQWKEAFDTTNISVGSYLYHTLADTPFMNSSKGQALLHTAYQTEFCPTKYYNHHLSHAAASFQTSPYNRATVVVIDAIGEWDTISIYGAYYDADGFAQYKKLWGRKYPNSIGLFYSAMTKRAGLRPLDEEYILMGMAAYGKPNLVGEIYNEVISSLHDIRFSQNLHLGIGDFPPGADEYDIAASSQNLVETLIMEVMKIARSFNWSSNLCYTGGVALNCSANRLLGEYFDSIWIMPNPGDAGSSMGAAALLYGKQLNWKHPYLGTSIPGAYPVDQLMIDLDTRKIIGVASGRAEFGPRALGNRSLLADPRGPEIKDKVNEIKRRQKFRPFAPVILEEHVDEYFEMPYSWNTSPYMQVTAVCKKPEEFPAIIHADGTSRVQTVSKDCGSGIRQLLEAWYAKTGCPMLLNTSLNIRGEPMVNDEKDAARFAEFYGVPVRS